MARDTSPWLPQLYLALFFLCSTAPVPSAIFQSLKHTKTLTTSGFAIYVWDLQDESELVGLRLVTPQRE